MSERHALPGQGLVLRPAERDVHSSSVATVSSNSFSYFLTLPKAAVRSFVRTWTAELKDRRIRVNAISPGPIDTPIFDQQAPTKEGADQARAQFAAAVPFGRLGRPEEIASTALFLASDEASFIAAATLSLMATPIAWSPP